MVEAPLQEADMPADINPSLPTEFSRARRLWFGFTSFFKANTGLLFVAASQALFSLMNVSVKRLNSIDPPISAIQIVDVGMSITYICCFVFMAWARIPDPILGPKGVRLLLLFRGVSGFIGLFGIYDSLRYLSLSDATVLTFLVPMFTAVSGALFLGESFSMRQALATIVSLIGVILIARPASLFGEPGHTALIISQSRGFEPPLPYRNVVTPSQRMLAVGVALLGVLGATAAYTCIRAIGKRAHPLHTLAFFSSQCVVFSTIVMLITGEKFIIPTKAEWLIMFLMIGLFCFIAQIFLTMGFQRETASRGSMAIYTQIVFAMIFERVFFNVVPSLLSAIGTILIISSAIYTALSKQTETNPSSNDESTTGPIRLSEDSEQGYIDPYEDRVIPRDQDHPNTRKGIAEERSKSISRDRHEEDRDLVLPLFDETVSGVSERQYAGQT